MKLEIALVIVAITIAAVTGFSIYSEMKNPSPKIEQHGTYPKCEQRTVNNACARWTIVRY